MASPYKTMCYVFAIVQIVLFGSGLMMIPVIFDAIENGIMNSTETLTGDSTQVDPQTMEAVLKILGVIEIICIVLCLIHVCMAVVLLIGVYKRRPNCVRAFRIWALVNLILQCLGVFGAVGQPAFQLLSVIAIIVFFAAEVWTAGQYYDIQLEEIRQEGGLNPNYGKTGTLLA